MTFPWTDQSENVLRAMMNEGRSGSEIAASLTRMFGSRVSRNAVIGKAHRLEIIKKRTPSKPVTKARPSKPVRKRKAAKPAVAPKPRPSPKPRRVPLELHPKTMLKVSILDVGKDQCRFPIDEERDGFALFCGNAASHGRPYCDHHEGRANLSKSTRKAALTTPPPPGIPARLWTLAMKAYARGVMASDAVGIINNAGYSVSVQSLSMRVYQNFVNTQPEE